MFTLFLLKKKILIRLLIIIIIKKILCNQITIAFEGKTLILVSSIFALVISNIVAELLNLSTFNKKNYNICLTFINHINNMIII